MTSVANTTAYDYTGLPQSGDKQYPVMPADKGKRPLLQSFGATGTAVFSGIIDNASVGEYNPDFWRDALLVYDQMRRSDGLIAGIIRAIEQPILSADWTIEPGVADNPLERKYGPPVQPAPSPQPPQMFAELGMPPQQGMPPMMMPPQQPPQPQQPPAPKPDAKAIEIAAFVQSNLLEELCYTTSSGQKLYQSWQEVLRHSLLHLWYGFMCFEKVWKVEDGFVKLARLTPLLPRTMYRWWVDGSTELVGVQQWTWKDYGYRYIDIPVSKIVRLANQQEGNNYEGISLLRPIFKHWQFVEGFERIQAIGIERDSVNFPFINVPATASDAEIQAAQLIVENIRANESMGGTLPPGFSIEFPANHQPFTEAVQSAIESHQLSIARSVVANFMMQGSTKYGGKSTDESQGDRFLEALQHVCNYVCEQFNQQMIRPLVDYNYDDVEVYPKLRCSKLALQNIQSLADLIQKLNAGNAPMLHATPEDESFVRGLIGMPSAPTNPVEASNPASPANSMQPDAAANPDAGTDANAPNTNVAPAANSASQATVGATSMSDMHDSVRLLQETMQAVLGVDAVERGLDHEAAVRLMNPYHRGDNGHFAHKNEAGAGAGQGGRSRSSSGGRFGSHVGSRSVEEAGRIAGRSGTHGGAGRSGGGGGGSSHGSGSRGKAEGEHASSGRRSRAPKGEGESTPHASRGSRAKGEGERAASTRSRATKSEPSYLKGANEREAAARAKLPTEHQYGKNEINIAAHADPRAVAKEFGNENLAGKLAPFSHAYLKESAALVGVKPGANKTETIARIVHRVTGERPATTPHATGKGSTTSRRSAKSDEELNGGHHVMTDHERAAAGLKAEVNPHTAPKGGFGKPDLQPMHTDESAKIDPTRRLDPREIADRFGEHQLGAALTGFSKARLNEGADKLGLSKGGTKEDLVARITQHVTQGRYSGRFPKGEATGKGASATKSSKAYDKWKSDYEAANKAYADAVGRHDLNAMSNAKMQSAALAGLHTKYSQRYQQEQSGHSTTTKGTTRSKSSADDEIAKLEARLATLKAGHSGSEGTGKGGTSRGSGSKSSGSSKGYDAWKAQIEAVRGKLATGGESVMAHYMSLMGMPRYAARYIKERKAAGDL